MTWIIFKWIFSLYYSSSRAHSTADLFDENACKSEFSMQFDFLVENFNWIIFILFSTVNICGNIQHHHFSFVYMKNHAQINLRLLVANNLWKSLVISTLSLTHIKIISHINDVKNEISVLITDPLMKNSTKKKLRALCAICFKFERHFYWIC